jgi:hypothetical protein
MRVWIWLGNECDEGSDSHTISKECDGFKQAEAYMLEEELLKRITIAPAFLAVS